MPARFYVLLNPYSIQVGKKVELDRLRQFFGKIKALRYLGEMAFFPYSLYILILVYLFHCIIAITSVNFLSYN